MTNKITRFTSFEDLMILYTLILSITTLFTTTFTEFVTLKMFAIANAGGIAFILLCYVLKVPLTKWFIEGYRKLFMRKKHRQIESMFILFSSFRKIDNLAGAVDPEQSIAGIKMGFEIPFKSVRKTTNILLGITVGFLAVTYISLYMKPQLAGVTLYTTILVISVVAGLALSFVNTYMIFVSGRLYDFRAAVARMGEKGSASREDIVKVYKMYEFFKLCVAKKHTIRTMELMLKNSKIEDKSLSAVFAATARLLEVPSIPCYAQQMLEHTEEASKEAIQFVKECSDFLNKVNFFDIEVMTKDNPQKDVS